MPKIPLYNKQISEVAGYNSVSTPLLQQAPVNTSAGIEKVVGKVLSITSKKMLEYSKKVDNQLMINEKDKLRIDYDKDLLVLQQTAFTPEDLNKGYIELNKKYEENTAKSKFSTELTHAYNQMKLVSNHKINNSIFSMKNKIALNELNTNINEMITSTMDFTVKKDNITSSLLEAVNNGIIDKATMNKRLVLVDKQIDQDRIYKLYLSNPEALLNSEKNYFPNISTKEFERYKDEARQSINRTKKDKKIKENVDKQNKKITQNKNFTKIVTSLINNKDSTQQLEQARQYIKNIESQDISEVHKRQLNNVANAILNKSTSTNVNREEEIITHSKNNMTFDKEFINAYKDNDNLTQDDYNKLASTNEELYIHNQISRQDYISNYKKISIKIPKENRSIIEKAQTKLDAIISEKNISSSTANKAKYLLNKLIFSKDTLNIEELDKELNRFAETADIDSKIQDYFISLFGLGSIKSNQFQEKGLKTKEQIKSDKANKRKRTINLIN